MKYKNCHQAIFIKRINRFIAEVNVDGQVERVHVKNTGRCKELFIEGVTCYLEKSDNPDRKTKYSLIAIMKGNKLINIDSQAPNAIMHEAVVSDKFPHILSARREVTYGNSRFDLKVELDDGREGFIEVKGVTLEEEGEVRFPDAPTQRGTKHLKELIKAKEEGYYAMAAFVVQMEGCHVFKPNHVTDPTFANTLALAIEKGVEVKAWLCDVTPESVVLAKEIPVECQ